GTSMRVGWLSESDAFEDWYEASAEIQVPMSTIRAASLAETRARSRLGIAIAAMMPMIATTISSSIRVKPFSFFIDSPYAFEALGGPITQEPFPGAWTVTL